MCFIFVILSAYKQGKFYDLLKNRYLRPKSSIKCANKRIDYFNCQNGGRQGCILSLMHGIQFVLKGEKTQYREDTNPTTLPNGSTINCLLYADDLFINLSETYKRHFPFSGPIIVITGCSPLMPRKQMNVGNYPLTNINFK